MGFTPNTRKGRAHHRGLRSSISHMQVPSAWHAMPAVNTTYELVHKFLSIGNTQLHAEPTARPTTPDTNKPFSRSNSGLGWVIHRPASTPIRHVAMAGRVGSRPSGSHVRVWAHRCPSSSSR